MYSTNQHDTSQQVMPYEIVYDPKLILIKK